MTIDTRSVANRRPLKFESYDQILADAERLAAAPRVTALGNWQLGQALAHLAAGMHLTIDGSTYVVPWYRRWLAWFFRNSILYGSMPAGFQVPAEVEGELASPRALSPADGFAALVAAATRLQATAERKAHPAFGEMTREEWDLLHYRHCELHLSFFVEETGSG